METLAELKTRADRMALTKKHDLAWGAPRYSTYRDSQMGACQQCGRWIQVMTHQDTEVTISIIGTAAHEVCPRPVKKGA